MRIDATVHLTALAGQCAEGTVPLATTGASDFCVCPPKTKIRGGNGSQPAIPCKQLRPYVTSVCNLGMQPRCMPAVVP